MSDATVCWITVENQDQLENVHTYARLIKKEYLELGRPRLVLVPFAHLSEQLAPAAVGRELLERLVKELSENGMDVVRDHFGSDKDVILSIKGHPGAARFRMI